MARDARCVFVSQLQVKASEEDVRFFFSVFCQVDEVALVQDRSTGRSKGFGYVELATFEDVSKALLLNGLPFVWSDGIKGFPVMVKITESHKNYTHQMERQLKESQARSQTVPEIELVETVGNFSARARIRGGPVVLVPVHRGKPMNARMLFVGNLDKTLTEADLKLIFEKFGQVDALHLKNDPNSSGTHALAFVRFNDVSAAATANERLNGFELHGSKLTANPVTDKSTSATQLGVTSASGAPIPDLRYNMDEGWSALDDEDGDRSSKGGVALRADRRVQLMSKLAGGAAQEWSENAYAPAQPALGLVGGMAPTIASVPVTAAPSQAIRPQSAMLSDATRRIAISHMFDSSQESEPNWQSDIESDTKEECSKYGQVERCEVDASTSRVFVTFHTLVEAKLAMSNLQNRWFAGKQIQVEFMPV